MIRSMTAFARESGATDQGLLTVELRSVNHRYLDCNLKLPENLRQLEPRIRELLRDRLGRGKVDCMMRLQGDSASSSTLTIDEDHLAQVIAAAEATAARISEARPLDPLALLQFPGVLQRGDDSDETLLKDALALFEQALGTLQANREREGQKLATLIADRLQQVSEETTRTREIVPELLQHQRDKVVRRIEELGTEVDQGRLEQELVYLMQKADVDEELDRLEAHVEEVGRALKKGGPCGRRLDFLMQELNREANTLSSKSMSTTTTQNAVELKVLIEQMREQIQNIE